MSDRLHRRARLPPCASKLRHFPLTFKLDPGYVVLHRSARDALRSSAAWRKHHVTFVLEAPLSDAGLNDVAQQVAAVCDRLVIYEASESVSKRPGERAARFARAVRASTRTEYRIIVDRHRALRHCIEAIAPGEIVLHGSESLQSAIAILEEYGGMPIAGGALGDRHSASLRAGAGRFERSLNAASSAAA